MRQISIKDAGPEVRDVMLAHPRTMPAATTTAADARRAFENPREHLLVLADDGAFAGALGRIELDGVPDDTLVADLPTAGRRLLAPGDPIGRALEIVDTDAVTRIPVVDGDGTLRGLVCFNMEGRCFCTAP